MLQELIIDDIGMAREKLVTVYRMCLLLLSLC